MKKMTPAETQIFTMTWKAEQLSRQVVVQKSDADSDVKGKTLAQKGVRQKPGAYNDIKCQKLVQRCGRKNFDADNKGIG